MIRVELIDHSTGVPDAGPDRNGEPVIVWLPAVPAMDQMIDLGDRGRWMVATYPPVTYVPHDGGCTVVVPIRSLVTP